MNRATLAPALTLLAALVFTGRASWRLGTYEFSVLQFAVLGLPAWSVPLLSVVELGGALLLLWRRSFEGGLVLLLGALATLAVVALAAGYLPVTAGLLATCLLVLAVIRRGLPGPLG